MVLEVKITFFKFVDHFVDQSVDHGRIAYGDDNTDEKQAGYFDGVQGADLPWT